MLRTEAMVLVRTQAPFRKRRAHESLCIAGVFQLRVTCNRGAPPKSGSHS